uniref:Uncharacterized protein n=1 Tax=viral metagenome TaxID=1070528 RepID=A0A6M3LPM9_9ZZZZ
MGTILEVVCAWCLKDMGEKDGEGVSGVSHGMCDDCYRMEELIMLAHERDKVESEFLRILKGDEHVLDAINDYWKCQQSGAD